MRSSKYYERIRHQRNQNLRKKTQELYNQYAPKLIALGLEVNEDNIRRLQEYDYHKSMLSMMTPEEREEYINTRRRNRAKRQAIKQSQANN